MSRPDGRRPDQLRPLEIVPDFLEQPHGSVVITQGTNQAKCTEAEIDNVACTAECHSQGNKAQLLRNTDDVEADTIYFDLCKGTVKAVGNVTVRVRQTPDETPGNSAPAKADGTKASGSKANGG